MPCCAEGQPVATSPELQLMTLVPDCLLLFQAPQISSHRAVQENAGLQRSQAGETRHWSLRPQLCQFLTGQPWTTPANCSDTWYNCLSSWQGKSPSPGPQFFLHLNLDLCASEQSVPDVSKAELCMSPSSRWYLGHPGYCV